MAAERKHSVAELLEDTDRIEAALRRAAREAALAHKREGLPLVIWEDGEVVLVPPDEIEVPSDGEV